MLNAAESRDVAHAVAAERRRGQVVLDMTGMETALDMADAAIERPHCIMIAGPNGAGKTTSSRAFAGHAHGVWRIVDADEIAGGLSGEPQLGALAAGKLALAAQARYIDERLDFAMETTLSGRRWPKFLDALAAADYRVTLYYLWISDPSLCIARVRTRMMNRGHGVSEEDIRRRYASGLQNLQSVVAPRVDAWHVADADAPSGAMLRYIAHGGRDAPLTVDDASAWAALQRATRPVTPPLPHPSIRRDQL